jgi:hypothetical protein
MNEKLEKEFQEVLSLLVKSNRCTEEELEKFSLSELRTLAIATAEYLENGDSLTIKDIQSTDYEFEIPDVITMVENPYYLGKELGFLVDERGRKEGRRQLYDFWLEQAQRVEEGNYVEILIIGLGKSTFMNLITIRDCMKIMALKNPQRHYNLMPSTKIFFAFFSVLKDLAMDAGYGQFQAMLENSPFFRQMMEYNTRLREGYRMQPPAKKRIAFKWGSQIQHTLSIAVFGVQIDEANFGKDHYDKKDEEKQSQVYKNYLSLRRRKESRFLKASGHFLMGSSKRAEADFLEQHIEKSKGRADVLIIDQPQYTVKKCRGEYSGKTFRILLGDITREPRILGDEEQVPEGLEDKVEVIPIEHKQAYVDDIYAALRDISGKAMDIKQAFIVNRDIVRQQLDKERKVPWKFSTRGRTVPNTITVSYREKDMIQDFLIKENLFTNGGKLPYPDAPRFVAVDTGYSGDALGIAMGCKAGVRVIKQEGKRSFFIPKYYTDFFIRVKGQKKEEYPLRKTENFIKFLIKDWGIYIAGLAADGFQSKQLLQDVEIDFPFLKSEQVSVDRDDLAYLQYRTAWYSEAMEGVYEDANFLVELFDLLHITTGRGGKADNMMQMVVDHPRIASDGFIGRKDVADAHCSMVNLCSKSDLSISEEEMHEQLAEMKALDFNKIEKEANDAVESAMKKVDAMKLDDILK